MKWYNRLYQFIKLGTGVTAFITCFEYLGYMRQFPTQQYYYVGDIALWLVFGLIMILEASLKILREE